MQRTIAFLSVFSLFYLNPPAAFATPLVDNSCQGISCNTDNSVNNNANGGAGGAGGTGGAAAASASGGNASNINAPVTVNTNAPTAKIEKGAVDVDTFNLNTAYNKTHVNTDVTNKQKQGQAQFQGQDQSQGIEGSANNSVSIDYRRNTASALAAGAVFGNRSCGKSAGIGAQGPGFGGSLSLPFSDNVCEGLELADWLAARGYTDKAVKILCLKDDDFAEVMGEACK